MRLFFAGLVVASALVGRTAVASPLAERIARYEAPAVCPTQVEAEARLSAHLDAVTNTTPALFTIVVRGGATFTGVLETIDASGERTTRELTAAACDEVVWSLVFIAALAISREARALPRPTRVEPPPAPPPSSAPPIVAEPPPARPEPAPPTPAPPPPTRGFTLELGAVGRAGAMPGIGFGAEVRAAYRSLALGAAFATTGAEPAASGEVSFWLFALRPQLCPLSVGERLRAEACVGAEVGVLRAASSGVPSARDIAAFWFVPELSVRGAWAIAAPFFLSIELRGGVPLHRPSFVVGPPEREVYAVPAVVGAAVISGGWSW